MSWIIITVLLLIIVVVNIGFVPDEYYVTEGVDDVVNLTVEVTFGKIGHEIMVMILLNTRNESNSG